MTVRMARGGEVTKMGNTRRVPFVVGRRVPRRRLKHPATSSHGAEAVLMDVSERTAAIEAILPTLATKLDLLQAINDLRNEIRQDNAAMRAEFAAMRIEAAQRHESLRAEMHQEFTRQTWRFITYTTSCMVVIGSALVGATFYIARHVTIG